jgi:UDP-GlcNAc:undecaprenyl-phosphate GlcNAc-1-phosphate transferase
VPLAGALIGFLFFNFNPATVYLGDSGSLLIGFLLGSCAVLWSEKAVTILGMTAPLMGLAVPLLDTVISVVRRYLRSKPLFTADYGHIHHRLLARGFSPRRVVFIIYGVAAIGASLSILESTYHQRYGVAVAIAFVLAVVTGIRYLNYAEFEKARRVLFSGNFRRILNAEMTLLTLREELAAASNADECWRVIRQTLPQFSFAGVELHLNGQTYSQISSCKPCIHSWTVRIELSDTEYINFLRDSSESPCPISADIIDAIGAILAAKAEELRQVVSVSSSDVKLYLVANN